MFTVMIESFQISMIWGVFTGQTAFHILECMTLSPLGPDKPAICYTSAELHALSLALVENIKQNWKIPLLLGELKRKRDAREKLYVSRRY